MTEIEKLTKRVEQIEAQNIMLVEATTMALTVTTNILGLMQLKRTPKLQKLIKRHTQVIKEALELLPEKHRRQTHNLVAGLQ